jgi:hypothetical protein
MRFFQEWVSNTYECESNTYECDFNIQEFVLTLMGVIQTLLTVISILMIEYDNHYGCDLDTQSVIKEFKRVI